MTTRWSLGLLSKLGEETYLSDLSGTVNQVTVSGSVDAVAAVGPPAAYLQLGAAGSVDAAAALTLAAYLQLGAAGSVDAAAAVSGEIEPAITLAGQIDGQSEAVADLTVDSRRVNWQFISSAWDGADAYDYVRAAAWSIGFGQPFAPMADVSQLSLTLRNTDRRFSPENSQSPYYPNVTFGRMMAVYSIYNGARQIMFRGWINAIQPAADQYGERTVQMEIVGFLDRVQNAEAFVPLQREVTADEVIEQIVESAQILPPKATESWQLGMQSLGVDTWISDGSDWVNAETGVHTINVIGDQWRNGVSAFGALRDTAGREGGRLHVDRDGVIQFWNRNHLLLDTTVKGEFDNTMAEMDYAYGDLFINKAVVTARPRTLGTTNETLGTLERATKLAAGESKEISFRYSDPDTGANVAGENAVAPQQTTDFTAAENEDGTGTDYTTSVTAAIVDEAATRTTVEFSNTAGVDVWLQPGAQIRGIKLTDYGAVDVESVDNDSITEFGPRFFSYPFEMDDVAVAENMADFLLAERQGPRGRIVSMSLAALDPALTEEALARTVGDRIRVVENQTDINANVFIIAEQHAIKENGDWTVTWLLEPASVNQYWQLGETDLGELGEYTYLA